MAADDREKAVDLAISQIERQFGKGAIMRLGGGEPPAGIRSTGDRLNRFQHERNPLHLNTRSVWRRFGATGSSQTLCQALNGA